MEYDEVTGRILLQISGTTYVDTLRTDSDKLLLTDLSRPGCENSHDQPPDPLDIEKSGSETREKHIDSVVE